MKFYMPATGTKTIIDTLQFFPATIKFPEKTTENNITKSARNILAIIKDPPRLSLFCYMGMKWGIMYTK